MLDDFELILEMDLLKTIKAAIIPPLGDLLIMDEEHPCFGTSVSKENKGIKMMLSTDQVTHGLKRGDPTFVATLLEVRDDLV